MRRFIAPLVTAVLVILLYSPVAQLLNGYLPFAAKDKLTIAFPLPEQTQAQVERIRAITGSRFADIDSQLRNKLKLRALTCSSARLPSWYESITQVRNEFANPPCFASQARQISDWLGLLEVGAVLKQAPLGTPLQSTSSEIQADDIMSPSEAVSRPRWSWCAVPRLCKSIWLPDLCRSARGLV